VENYLKIEQVGGETRAHIRGRWVFENVAQLERSVAGVTPEPGKPMIFDCRGLEAIDISGAWVLHDRMNELTEAGIPAEFRGVCDDHFKFLQHIIDVAAIREYEDDALPEPSPHRLRRELERLGHAAAGQVEDVGQIARTVLDGMRNPRLVIVGETIRQLFDTGARAVPIIVTITFLVGIVLAYQASAQLEQLGAKVFVVDLVSIAVMREMAGLMAAVMVAGRSGSAFAAALGTMKLNEELDALRVMGLNPNQVLVLPRVLGLLIAMPLLTVIADLAGLAGGALIAIGSLDISPTQFLERVAYSTGLDDFYAGLVKAPFFAVLIASVSTLRGLQVTHGAEELGRLTTRAVVESIFLIIVADAFFTTLFTRIGF
jgi:phospholipid/cholesterol/gamma-HCH transport system permease protein